MAIEKSPTPWEDFLNSADMLRALEDFTGPEVKPGNDPISIFPSQSGGTGALDRPLIQHIKDFEGVEFFGVYSPKSPELPPKEFEVRYGNLAFSTVIDDEKKTHTLAFEYNGLLSFDPSTMIGLAIEDLPPLIYPNKRHIKDKTWLESIVASVKLSDEALELFKFRKDDHRRNFRSFVNSAQNIDYVYFDVGSTSMKTPVPFQFKFEHKTSFDSHARFIIRTPLHQEWNSNIIGWAVHNHRNATPTIQKPSDIEAITLGLNQLTSEQVMVQKEQKPIDSE